MGISFKLLTSGGQHHHQHYRPPLYLHHMIKSWSAFVNKKKLVSGDAVLFLRPSSSEFIVPYRKFSRSLVHSFSAGMNFKQKMLQRVLTG
ncbi:PREDICTED: auxin response factor 3-like [Ipomoea nil]|uniref:auxin response factor 3-like n=1 Tax=Ipomoea nil TaxID=35883 RepID=UPI0009009B9D|nr:PREDICTED: auxin response factor 3-like [Ipomoea nil]